MALKIPNLDTKNFDNFFEEAKTALPALAPKWTDYNLSDPGITILELFAWLGDISSYRLNRVHEQHRLKYLKLLGVTPKPVQPATCWISCQSNKIGIIPKDTEFLASDTKHTLSIPFQTQKEIDLQNTELLKVKIKNERGMLEYDKPFPEFFYPFGQITKKGHYFELTFKKAFSANFSLTFIFYKNDLPSIGEHANEKALVFPSAELNWSYSNSKGVNWTPLLVEEDNSNSFSKSGTIYFKNTTNARKIRCQLSKNYFENAPRVEKILISTTQAIQIKELKKPFETVGIGLPKQTLNLNQSSLLSLSIDIEDEAWQEEETLEMFNHDSKVFHVDKSKGIVTFGDGIHGTIPALDAKISCTYITSVGNEGNILEHMEWEAKEVRTDIQIENHFPAINGKDTESIDDAYIAFKKDLKTPYQAVTDKDFEYLAIHTPGVRVARAKAIAKKEQNRVEVIVLPFSFQKQIKPTQGFLKTVCQHLDKHRLITTQVEAIPPQYASVSIKIELKMKDNVSEEDVKKRVTETLELFLDPIKGWKDSHGWPFGHNIYKSDIYALIEEVAGVDCILDLHMSIEGAYGKYTQGNIILEDNILPFLYRVDIYIFTTEESCRSSL